MQFKTFTLLFLIFFFFLVYLLGNKNITVALTPNGYADAPQGDHFVMPYEIETTFTNFLQMLQSEDISDIAYLQNQNSSFTEQFNELIPDACNVKFYRAVILT